MWIENLKILILDDYESIRTMLKAHLKQLDHKGEILEAADVSEAKAHVNSHKESIQFILSDWNLPDGTGLEFLKFVRGFPELAELPFLMITTENETTKIIDAVSAGASNYLIKPWNLEGLKEKLDSSWYKHHPEDDTTATKKIAPRRRRKI
ncbi:MAG: response regulator [Bacteriovoracaceae bacterium]|jgi:two-component system, chemotaxis family, chemotaxis protein CheY|nr:response regulator [Bacteriovoracaceae bacterium]